MVSSGPRLSFSLKVVAHALSCSAQRISLIDLLSHPFSIELGFLAVGVNFPRLV